MFGKDDLDKDGKVEIWAFHEKAMIRRWPIDAKEMIQAGQASKTKPEEIPEDTPQ